MGVTIHFEGQLKSDNDFDRVMSKAQNFAQLNEMTFDFFDEPIKKLSRVKDNQDWDFEGATKGIKIQPSPNSDPLWLEFDSNNYIQEFCKTQFAGSEVHLKIIALLKEIQVHFNEFLVFDEGEYWETNDEIQLQNAFDSYFDAAEKAIAENPKLKGPFRLEDGRIIDLMET